MREILFRGKKLINDEWVEGLLVKDTEFYGEPDNHAYIVNHKHPSGCFGNDIYFEVDPDTVSQYTGLTDKNGKKIFEGDIIYGYLDNGVRKEAGVVVFDDGCWEVHNHVGRWLADLYDVNKPEVIGNIHDNPELLKGGDSDGV